MLGDEHTGQMKSGSASLVVEGTCLGGSASTVAAFMGWSGVVCEQSGLVIVLDKESFIFIHFSKVILSTKLCHDLSQP